ncbi:MAG: YlbD family protein [Bacilli bacterium]|nr:YlbD family protein [Bacilli bacterium]
MSKIEFKEFVKKNPHLIKQVESGNTNWQKLYELYDLYGESNEVWNKYQTNDTRNSNNTSNQQTNPLNFGNNIKDILNMVKGIDLNTVQKGLNSLDKAIEAFKGIIPDKTSNLTDTYEPRPTYKYFED